MAVLPAGSPNLAPVKSIGQVRCNRAENGVPWTLHIAAPRGETPQEEARS